MMSDMKKDYYGAMDGLRTIACIGIVMMHVATNNAYEIRGVVYNAIIPSFTDFVFLFMAVSAFGMCCGYYEKIVNGAISLNDFYGKRFRKILPFFGFLVLLDVAISPSIEALYEAFADLTLLFGFLPNAGNISVMGVGWFIGLIFVFYICFPFFCVLLQNRRRAWLALGVSLIYNIACAEYFEIGRSNILYSGCYFLAGGLIYLYRKEIMEMNRWLGLSIGVVCTVLYYILKTNTIGCLLFSTAWLEYAVICVRGAWRHSLLENRATKFISGISMEIYLSHMVIFRAVERVGLNTVIGNGWAQYAVSVALVLVGTIAFAVAIQKIFAIIADKSGAIMWH